MEAIKSSIPLTICTVVLNDRLNLEKTIGSIINQRQDNFEYIVVDGNSSDGIIDIIKKYEEHIDYWSSEPDKGIYDAMNK
ncbi:MAG: glycosyltransferase, partial [Bacteroidales bacterium]|nr:glycosyltransferase [Bacteroidales bacterium]